MILSRTKYSWVRNLAPIIRLELTYLFTVMEYCSGGPVQWANESRQPLLHLEQTRRIMRDVLLGLEHCA